MYRSASPYNPPESGQYPHPYNPQTQSPYSTATPGSGAQIVPGSITYTTSTGPDGRLIYHPFKAVPASYQTSNGIVSGIQWVPAEATQVLPAGAQPATRDFAESWHRGHFSKEDHKALKDWQKSEEKRRRKEEKESAKMLRDKEYLQQARDGDAELRLARERDAAARERRRSFNAGMQGPPAAPTGAYTFPSGGNQASAYSDQPYGTTYGAPNAAGYPPRERTYSTGGSAVGDLDRQFADMGIGGEYQRERRVSRPAKYSEPETMTERARRISGNLGVERPAAYSTSATSNYGGASTPYGIARPHTPGGNAAKPYPTYPEGFMSTAANSGYPPSPARSSRGIDPYGRSASPMPQGNPGVYPPGHILEGQPIARSGSPLPGAMGSAVPAGVGYSSSGVPFPQGSAAGTSPHLAGASGYPEGQLAAPEGFSRPVNAALPYTPFDTMKIQDMDDFMDVLPKMPAVLAPHDVYVEDWTRLMQDLSLAWAGRLPVPQLTAGGHVPKRATLAAQVIDLWNSVFFARRGVEIVIYKGRERRSGPNAGFADLPAHLLHDALSSSSESSDDSDDFDDDAYTSSAYNVYGNTSYGMNQGQMAGIMDARRRRQEMKAERKRRRREKKIRRKARARAKRYALYLTSIPVPYGGHGSATPYSGGAHTVGPGYGL